LSMDELRQLRDLLHIKLDAMSKLMSKLEDYQNEQ